MDELFDQESLNKKVTNEEIVAAQTKLGVILPDDFLELMKISNGGYLNYTKQAFPVDFSLESGDVFIEVEEIMGIHEEGILLSDYFAQEWDLPKDLVLFSGGGHAWIGFNYAGREIQMWCMSKLDDGDGNNFQCYRRIFYGVFK